MRVTSWMAGMLSAALLLLWLGSASASLIVSIEPAVTEASVGDTVEIAVHADGPDSIGWYWLSISTTPEVVTYLDCRTDILLGCPSGWNCMLCGPTGEPGVFEADCACFGQGSCVGIPGDLITIRYIVVGEGVSPVAFEFARVSDCARDMIVLESVIDGSIVVGEASIRPGDSCPDPFVGSFTGFPNPFREGVTLRFQVPPPSDGIGVATKQDYIKIFDCTGRVVRTLEVIISPGEHSITWDGSDWKGGSVPPGIYFCRFPAKDGFGTYKITRVD
ncbi:FlgD immunoglobulin-like domain containing protein [Candidatus Eisenbacteria bacterium]|uniref:FlgD immunoglobulin-like domain containing protein n=1 Tax=Eiseniibacteriota bacterium TaxID=2212470 RepID=A0ABV6YQ71_UNCEI